MESLPIGPRIRALRKQAGLTQAQLAEKCALKQADISDIEAGKRPHVRYQTVRSILDALEAQSSSQTSVGES